MLRRRLSILSALVAVLAFTGCSSDDDAETTAAPPSPVTTAEKPAEDRAGSAQRSFERYLEPFRERDWALNVNGVRGDDGGWIDILWAGDSKAGVDFEQVRSACGVIVSWLIETDERWANVGHVELFDGTRLATCEVGSQDLEG